MNCSKLLVVEEHELVGLSAKSNIDESLRLGLSAMVFLLLRFFLRACLNLILLEGEAPLEQDDGEWKHEFLSGVKVKLLMLPILRNLPGVREIS